jgi:hypothetical protein
MNREMIPSAALLLGLDSRQNTKPSLILRSDCQQSVSRGRAPCPRLFGSVEPPWGVAASVNLFAELNVALARDPHAPLGPIPHGGRKPPGPGRAGGMRWCCWVCRRTLKRPSLTSSQHPIERLGCPSADNPEPFTTPVPTSAVLVKLG